MDALTIPQFKRTFNLKKLPELKFSELARWSYMGFFKLDGITYKVNCYGPPGYVEEAKEIPKDLKI
jgi:hypothetical protein